MFYQNLSHTFDKIVVKHITTRNALKANLEPKGQGHSRNQKTMTLETKNMLPKKIGAEGPLVIDVTLTPTRMSIKMWTQTAVICRPPPYRWDQHKN